MSCSDSTGPASALEVRVPQETLYQLAPGAISLQFVAYNRSNAAVSVGICSFTLEQEAGVDTWKTVRTSDVLCIAFDIQPGKEFGHATTFSGLAEGRYRIAVPWYAKGQSSGEVLAYSNVFNVS